MAGGDGQLRVLGAWASPFVNRVRFALHLKGLDYENVEEDLTNKSELLLASNPVHKKVPVLLHGGRPVSESLVILEYLDDAFPAPPLLPADPYQRAVARFWAAYVDAKLYVSMFAALMGPTEEARSAATAEALAALGALEGALAEGSGGGKAGFFAGDAPGYVDVALGGFIGWLRAWDKITGAELLDAGRTPLLAAWARRFAELDAAKGVIPEPEHIAEFANVLLARAAPAAGN